MEVEKFIVVKGTDKKGEIIYYRKPPYVGHSDEVVTTITSATWFTIDDLEELRKAVEWMVKSSTIASRTIEVIGYCRDTSLQSDPAFRELIEKIALPRLTKTELEILGLMSQAVLHRLAGDL